MRDLPNVVELGWSAEFLFSCDRRHDDKRGYLMPMMRDASRRLQRFGRTLWGRDFVAEPEIACARVRLGSEYGGWWVRPDWLASDSVVLSVGVGSDVTFDLAMIERFGCVVHAFDSTPKSVEWVIAQQLPREFKFYESGLAGHDGEMLFALPGLPGHQPDWDCYVATTPDGDVARSAFHAVRCQVSRLVTLVQRIGASRVDLLKMDIEGSEYEVIDDMLAGEIRPRQLLVEYHYRHQFGDENILARTLESVASLRRAGYRIFARSPSGMEFSMCLEP